MTARELLEGLAWSVGVLLLLCLASIAGGAA